jgi:hypothetical protein
MTGGREGGRECGFVAGQFDELTYADDGSPSLERSRVEERERVSEAASS